jgi:ribonuclease R
LSKKKSLPGTGDIKRSILAIFKKAPSASFKFNLLFKRLKLTKNNKALLRETLRELIYEDVLSKNGKYYELKQKSALYQGVIVLDKELEYAVEITNDAGHELVRIRKKNLQTALKSDTVEVSIVEYADKEFKEAIVEKIIKRAKHRIVGKLEYASGRDDYAFVIPDDKKFRKDIYIPPEAVHGAKNGDKVICEIKEWLYQDLSPEGKIVEVLGRAGEVETEFKSLIKKYGLSKTFPKKIRDELKKLSEEGTFEVTEKEISKRLDLRDKVLFTIDPADAKDFDDAVSLELNMNGNYLLGVHIADVSYYVRANTGLDDEALRRGTSVYLMNDVVPMLPEKLSNDICSLKEGVDRFTFSVFMEINKKGAIVDFSITKSVIRSKKRFSYEEVQGIIDNQEGIFLDELNLMNELHKILYMKRIEEGSLDFESPEVQVEIASDGSIKNIKPKLRLESMRIIEDFMLAANKCVTLFIERKDPKPPFIYRIHDLPDKKKIKELAYFVKQFGITLNPESKQSIQNMLEQIREKPEEYLINDITIRSMSKAIYSESNVGHYGLGFDYYTHFTSPIRRYPDLMVHRILFDSMQKMNYKRMSYYRDILPGVCKQSTETEINAVSAEREAVKILQIQYLEKHIDKVFWGIISGVSEYGVYIEISENLIEGMIRLKELNDDYYILDEKNFQLIGRHRRKKYRIGDKVKVKVAKVDKERKWIDFVFVGR